MDDKISNIGAARFNRATNPSELHPFTALDAAREWCESIAAEKGEQTQHIIVFCGRTCKDGGSATRFFQAGSFTHHGQVGLCVEGAAMMRESKDTYE